KQHREQGEAQPQRAPDHPLESGIGHLGEGIEQGGDHGGTIRRCGRIAAFSLPVRGAAAQPRSAPRPWPRGHGRYTARRFANGSGDIMATATYDVIGVGNAIVDVLSPADEAFLTNHGLAKGMMTLIDSDRARALYDAMGPGVEVSGGSAANTLAGLASLGGRGAYIGKVRNDTLGGVFSH